MKFLNKQKGISYKQYGFRKAFSTAHAIINLIYNIESAIDKKQLVCGIFIDFYKKHLIQLIITFYSKEYNTMKSVE